MQSELVAKYLTELKTKTGLSFEAIAEKSNRPVSTVKNLCTGKTEDPRLDTVAPVVYALGGSIDEMCNPGKTQDEMKKTSVLSLKDSYEYQTYLMKQSYDDQVNNIRSHHEQHHNDLKDNFEKRLSDKREIIECQKSQIEKLETANKTKTIIIIVLVAIFIFAFFGLLTMEIIHPEHGWIRY
jgi:predicted ribosome quality control (RQC) complex YloA/Tae2 family protein